MNVFALILRWSPLSDTAAYPMVSELEEVPDNGTPAVVAFRDAVRLFASTVAVEPDYIYYSRAAKDRVVLTVSIYRTKAAYQELRATHELVFARLEQARAPFAEARSLAVEQKEGEIELGSFDENDFDSVNALFESLA